MTNNWWYIGQQNMLAGIEGDETNPAKLPDTYIAYFFNTIPLSIPGYEEVRSTLTAEEQARCDSLLSQAQHFSLTPVKNSDKFQSTMNKQGVYTTGSYGGTRRGGNC